MSEYRFLSEHSINFLTYLKSNRKIIIICGCIVLVFTTFILFSTPNKYQSRVIFIGNNQEVPGDIVSKFGSIAGIAGIDLGGSGNQTFSEDLIPEVVKSWDFRKKLISDTVFTEDDENVSFKTYYKELRENDPLEYIFNSLFEAIFGETEQPVFSYPGIEDRTNLDFNISKYLGKNVRVEIDRLTDAVEINVITPDRLVSASLTRNYLENLSAFIINHERKKSLENLAFIDKVLLEKRIEFDSLQLMLDTFDLQNRNIKSEFVKSSREKMKRELDILAEVLISLSKRKEEAKIKVEEDTPFFTVIENSMIADRKIAPSRLFSIIKYLIIYFILVVIIYFSKYVVKILLKKDVN